MSIVPSHSLGVTQLTRHMQLTHAVSELQPGSTGKRVTMSWELIAVIAMELAVCKALQTN